MIIVCDRIMHVSTGSRKWCNLLPNGSCQNPGDGSEMSRGMERASPAGVPFNSLSTPASCNIFIHHDKQPGFV